MMGKTIRHINRYRDIASALIRHGFGYIVEEIELFQMLSLPKKMIFKTKTTRAKTIEERIRLVLEELGPTFIKLGQVASTRPDLLPEALISEIEKLQDDVTVFSFQEVKEIINQELGAPIEELFCQLEEIPIAAASIGQVHFGILKTGESVVIKVQRPHIIESMKTDLEILKELAAVVENHFEWAAHYQIVKLIEGFSRSLLLELDYLNEGKNAEKIEKQFVNDNKVYVPKIYWKYCTKKVLTMEYIQGSNVLEVGCGTGRTACYLTKKFNCNITALDNRLDMLEKAKKRTESEKISIDFVHGDLLNLPFQNGQFDVIVAESVTLFADQPKAISEYYRVLKRGGVVYDREMMQFDGLEQNKLEKFLKLFNTGHLPSEQEWKQSFLDSGFRAVKIWNKTPYTSGIVESDLKYPDQYQEMDDDALLSKDVWEITETFHEVIHQLSDHLGFALFIAYK